MTPAGNSQLDDFVDEPGGLTGNEPPLVEPEIEEVWEDPEIYEDVFEPVLKVDEADQAAGERHLLGLPDQM